jgi:hypothetical protein
MCLGRPARQVTIDVLHQSQDMMTADEEDMAYDDKTAADSFAPLFPDGDDSLGASATAKAKAVGAAEDLPIITTAEFPDDIDEEAATRAAVVSAGVAVSARSEEDGDDDDMLVVRAPSVILPSSVVSLR